MFCVRARARARAHMDDDSNVVVGADQYADALLVESAEALADAEEEAAERSAFAVVQVGVVDGFLMLVNAALLRYFFGWPLPSASAVVPLMQLHFLHMPGLMAFCLPMLATPPAWLGVVCGMLSALLLGTEGYVAYMHALALATGSVRVSCARARARARSHETQVAPEVLLPAVLALGFVLTAAWYGVCALGFSRHYTWCGEPRRQQWLRRRRRRRASPPPPPPRRPPPVKYDVS